MEAITQQYQGAGMMPVMELARLWCIVRCGQILTRPEEEVIFFVMLIKPLTIITLSCYNKSSNADEEMMRWLQK